MACFEELLAIHRDAVERYVRFRLPTATDADDVFQEVCLTACQRFDQLKHQDAFKAWMVSIARNKCTDYFRRKGEQSEISLDELSEQVLSGGQYGESEHSAVIETLELLDKRDREILALCFWEELPQAEIARRLNVPLGTVKSRLYAAKQRFKSKYLCPTQLKRGELLLNKLPEYLPEYTITEQAEAPFSAKWEELIGWFLIPRLGEKLSWGMYDLPSRKCSHIYEMAVTGRAEVHGMEGVELTARESSYSRKEETIERTFVAQLMSGQMDIRSRSISKRGSAALRRTLFLVMGTILRCSPANEPVYQFMDKKRAEGKPYRVYMMASANKFLRIYYATVKQHLDSLEA